MAEHMVVRASEMHNFARFVQQALLSKGHLSQLSEACDNYGGTPLPYLAKAAVDALSTTSPGFIEALSRSGIAGPVLSLVAKRTVLGRLAPFMRRVPFETPVLTELSPANARWVGQKLAKPVTTFTLDAIQLPASKIVSLVVFTDDLLRVLGPATEASINDNIVASVVKFTDAALLDPTTAAVAGTNPASLTYGVVATASTGSTAAQITADIKAMLQRMIVAGSDLSGVTLVVHPQTAVYLSSVLTTGGDFAFPEMGATGGFIWKIPVITSLACGDWNSPSERQIVAIDARGILLADDNQIGIDASREASMQLVTTPSDSAAQLISLWQLNLSCLRVERFVSWEKADPNSVQVISQVTY